jgi:hypothetical protein
MGSISGPSCAPAIGCGFNPRAGKNGRCPIAAGNAFGLGPEFEVRFVMDVDKKKKKKAPSRATVSETFRAGLFEDAQFRP